MATPKKKHLIELMIEAGVKWPDGAEYAAQDSDRYLAFYKSKPWHENDAMTWISDNAYISGSVKKLPSLYRNWHQTIVTREQYAKAVAAINNEQKPQYCTSVMRQMPSETIESLLAEIKAKREEHNELVVKTKALALVIACTEQQVANKLKEYGFMISPITTPSEPEQPVITDWRDLQVGDVIELTGSFNPCWKEHSGHEMTVTKVYPDHSDYDVQVILSGKSGGWALGGNTTWCFIRRP